MAPSAGAPNADPQIATDWPGFVPVPPPRIDNNLWGLAGFTIAVLAWANYLGTTLTGWFILPAFALAGFVLCLIGWNRKPRAFAVAGMTLVLPVIVALGMLILLMLLGYISESIYSWYETVKEWVLGGQRIPSR